MTQPKYTPQERIDLIQKLRQKMMENQHNAVDIHEQIGVTPQTINTWLRGDNLPRLSKIEKILDYIHDRPKQTATFEPPETGSKDELSIWSLALMAAQINEKVDKIMKELGI